MMAEIRYDKSRTEKMLESKLDALGIILSDPFVDSQQGFTMPFVERATNSGEFRVEYDRWLDSDDFPEYVGQGTKNEMPLEKFVAVANDPLIYRETISLIASDGSYATSIFLKDGNIRDIEHDGIDVSLPSDADLSKLIDCLIEIYKRDEQK